MGRANMRARKPKKDSEPYLQQAAKEFGENVKRASPYAAASYTLIGAILVLGAIGYALDQSRGTSPWFLIGGLMLGIVAGFYELAKVVWRR